MQACSPPSNLLAALAHAEPARPFDFIIHGELLRKSLEAHLTEHKLSAVRVPQQLMFIHNLKHRNIHMLSLSLKEKLAQRPTVIPSSSPALDIE